MSVAVCTDWVAVALALPVVLPGSLTWTSRLLIAWDAAGLHRGRLCHPIDQLGSAPCSPLACRCDAALVTATRLSALILDRFGFRFSYTLCRHRAEGES